MKLTFEQIKGITFGALKVAQTDKGFEFERCTKKQVAAWYQADEGLGVGAEKTTGVRLDFHTDSKTLTFQPTHGDVYEVHLNGLQHYRLHAGEYIENDRPVVLALGEGKKRVTLIFPSHTRGALGFVELDDGATLTPHTYQTKILFLGDSITQGWNSRYDSQSFAYRVAAFLDADFINMGVGGSYAHESVFDTVDFAPDRVIVAYGTNDFGHYKTQDEMRAHFGAYLDLVCKHYAGVPLFVISPVWREDEEKPKTMGSFTDACRIVKEEGARVGATVVDGSLLVPHHMDFYADALHPNDLGFGVYAERLLRYMI